MTPMLYSCQTRGGKGKRRHLAWREEYDAVTLCGWYAFEKGEPENKEALDFPLCRGCLQKVKLTKHLIDMVVELTPPMRGWV